MKTLHSIPFAVAVTIAVLLGNKAQGKAKPGLEVGFTYREVRVVMDEIPEGMKKLGLNEQIITFAVRQKLMSRGLKPVEISPTGSFLRITFTFGVAPRGNYASCYVNCVLAKNPVYYGLPTDRGLDSPVYGFGYGNLVGSHPGIIKETVLDGLKKNLAWFINDYVESNVAYDQTFNDLRLRGVDRAIKGNSFRLRSVGGDLKGIGEWRKRYEGLIKNR